MTKQGLIKNGSIEFESETDTMTVTHVPREQRRGWMRPFMIMLNCKCVGDFKTFKGLENRVNQLIEQRNLELV